jgi:hypothetical protein
MATGDRILGPPAGSKRFGFFFGGSARDLDGSRRAGYVLANKLKEIRMDQNEDDDADATRKTFAGKTGRVFNTPHTAIAIGKLLPSC